MMVSLSASFGLCPTDNWLLIHGHVYLLIKVNCDSLLSDKRREK